MQMLRIIEGHQSMHVVSPTPLIVKLSQQKQLRSVLCVALSLGCTWLIAPLLFIRNIAMKEAVQFIFTITNGLQVSVSGSFMPHGADFIHNPHKYLKLIKFNCAKREKERIFQN